MSHLENIFTSNQLVVEYKCQHAFFVQGNYLPFVI